MPSPQFWNQTYRLLEDSEVRKENRASGDVRLGATRSEGQEKLGLPELGRARWTLPPPFPPQPPCYPTRASTQQGFLFPCWAPCPAPGVFISPFLVTPSLFTTSSL